MVNIRQATVDDLPAMQTCNLMCLPENYHMKVCPSRSSFCRGKLFPRRSSGAFNARLVRPTPTLTRHAHSGRSTTSTISSHGRRCATVSSRPAPPRRAGGAVCESITGITQR
jgi:hypothetical protein